MFSKRLLLAVLAFAIAPLAARADDWPQFRGENGCSITTSVAPPLTWSVDTGANIAWASDLPGNGVSSPIVVEGRVIVTAASGAENNRLHVLAFDSMTGKRLWHRQFWATGRTLCFNTSSVAAPTPVSDGKLLYAFFSSNDLVCLDLDGQLRWLRGLTIDHPGLGNDIGMASSPVLVQESARRGAVIVQCDCQANAFVAAFDKSTGESLWEVPRTKQDCWTSPVVLRYGGAEVSRPGVLLQNRLGLQLLDISTGSPLWEQPCEGGSISSPAAQGNLVLAASDGLSAFRRTSDGLDFLWRKKNVRPGSASPVAYEAQSRAFAIGRGGILIAVNLEDGEQLYKKRLKGTFWTTPLLAGNRLYCINQDGKAFVVDADSKGEVLAESDFGQDIYGSPAAADGGLFVRSNQKLWKIATIDQAQVQASPQNPTNAPN